MKLIGVLLLLLLTACSQVVPVSRYDAYLAPGVGVALPAVQGENFSHQQRITMQRNSRQYQWLAFLEVDEEALHLLGLTLTGVRLFEIRYDVLGIHTLYRVSSSLPESAQILTDVMIAFWPDSAWTPVLPEGWVLRDSESERTLLAKNGEPMILVRYEQTGSGRLPVELLHKGFGYQVVLEKLDEER